MSADRRLRGATVHIVDLETTGVTATDRIVEVAIVVIDGLLEEGRTEPRVLFQSLVDPEVPGPWAGTQVHRLQPTDVRGAPTWAQVWERIAPLIRDPKVVLCAHNAPFDRRFLSVCTETTDTGAVPPTGEWLDTMRILRQIVGPDAPKGSTKLSQACERRRIRTGGHRATSDAMATARLLCKLIPESYRLTGGLGPHPRPTIREWLDWQSQPRSKARVPATQESLFGTAGAPARSATARAASPRAPRRCWRVRGGEEGDMWLAGRRNDEGPWWVISAGKGQSYWSLEEAKHAASWSGGVVVEVARATEGAA